MELGIRPIGQRVQHFRLLGNLFTLIFPILWIQVSEDRAKDQPASLSVLLMFCLHCLSARSMGEGSHTPSIAKAKADPLEIQTGGLNCFKILFQTLEGHVKCKSLQGTINCPFESSSECKLQLITFQCDAIFVNGIEQTFQKCQSSYNKNLQDQIRLLSCCNTVN